MALGGAGGQEATLKPLININKNNFGSRFSIPVKPVLSPAPLVITPLTAKYFFQKNAARLLSRAGIKL
jgi:hypothetical protein